VPPEVFNTAIYPNIARTTDYADSLIMVARQFSSAELIKIRRPGHVPRSVRKLLFGLHI